MGSANMKRKILEQIIMEGRRMTIYNLMGEKNNTNQIYYRNMSLCKLTSEKKNVASG